MHLFHFTYGGVLRVGLDRRTLLIGAVLGTTLPSLQGCTERSPIGSLNELVSAAKTKDRVRVGFIPYFEISDSSPNSRIPTGFMPEVFKVLCAKVGVDATLINFVPVAWDTFGPALKNHKIDLSISGTFITPARSQIVNFCRPLFDLGNGAAVRRDDKRFDAISAVDGFDQTGLKVAVVSGEQSDEYVARHFHKAEIVRLAGPDLTAAPQAVAVGRADVALSDQYILKRYLAAKGGAGVALRDVLDGRPFSTLPIAWAVSQDSGSLAADISAILNDLEQAGQLAAIRSRWPSIPFAK